MINTCITKVMKRRASIKAVIKESKISTTSAAVSLGPPFWESPFFVSLENINKDPALTDNNKTERAELSVTF